MNITFICFIHGHWLSHRMQHKGIVSRFGCFQLIVNENIAGSTQVNDVTTEFRKRYIIPTIFWCIMYIALFTTFQPQRRDYLTVCIGSVAQHIAYFLSYIIAGNPSITFHTYALPHAIDKNCIVGTSTTMTKHAMYISKFNVVATAVENGLATKEGVESILVGQSMGSRTIRATAKAPHGIAAHTVPISLERCQAGFRENISPRQSCQAGAIRQSFITLQPEPGQITGLSQQSLLQVKGFDFKGTAYKVGCISIAGKTSQSIQITDTYAVRTHNILV